MKYVNSNAIVLQLVGIEYICRILHNKSLLEKSNKSLLFLIIENKLSINFLDKLYTY